MRCRSTIWLSLALVLPLTAQGTTLHGFSVASDKQVVFAPGNLQYNAMAGTHLCADGTTQQGSWRFAEHQWNYIGIDNQNASATYNGWIDLFAWGTSGWNSGADQYEPWAATGEFTSNQYYISGTASISMTGSYRYADWAVYNTIGNDAPETWRTLTYEEWRYMLEQRNNAADLCGKATIGTIQGFVLLPDDYPLTDTSLPDFVSGKNNNYTANLYTLAMWLRLEAAGAVFLPAAGWRFEHVYYHDNGSDEYGDSDYWSASHCELRETAAWEFDFQYNRARFDRCERWAANAVRPVRDYTPVELCTDGILLFHDDFGGNSPDDPECSTAGSPGMDARYINVGNGEMGDGHYKICKRGWTNGTQWHPQDDHTHSNDYTRGYMLEIDGLGGNNPIYSATIDGLWADVHLSFSAYVVNVYDAGHMEQLLAAGRAFLFPRLKFEAKDANSDTILATHMTGDIHPDYTKTGNTGLSESVEWHLAGMDFIVPQGVESVQITIYDDADARSGNGKDFALDDIEVHICSNAEYRTADTTVCDTLLPYTWHGLEWAKDGTKEQMTKDIHGADSVYSAYTLSTMHCPYPPLSISRDTTICDTVTLFVIHGKVIPYSGIVLDTIADSYGYDSIYCTWNISSIHCPYPPVTIYSDTTVCDTLDVIAWRGKIGSPTAEWRDTIKEAYGFDSVYYVLNVLQEHCCPSAQIVYMDTTVCDTLLPFTWQIDGRALVFEQTETHEVNIPHTKWENCTGILYIYTLDTVRCNRLYPLIVNKYNWLLLCDNVLVAALFPELQIAAYQWFKDGMAIPDATEDDYSEQNELHGTFQLRLQLSDGQFVYSSLLTIVPESSDAPIHVRIYNSRGELVIETDTPDASQWPHLHAGLYLLRIEQGENIRVVKTMIAP